MPNQHEKTVSALEAIRNVTAPAQKHATDDAVYTALFLSGRDYLTEWASNIGTYESLI